MVEGTTADQTLVVMQLDTQQAVERWDDILPFVHRAHVRGRADWKISELRTMVSEGKATVIVAGTAAGLVLAVLIVVIEEGFAGRNAIVLSIAGRGLSIWRRTVEQFLWKFADENDCQRVEILSARKGWARALSKTWRVTGVSMELCHGS